MVLKKSYVDSNEEVINITKEDAKAAIKWNVKDEAVSWDFIPVKAIKSICGKYSINTDYKLNKIAELFNE